MAIRVPIDKIKAEKEAYIEYMRKNQYAPTIGNIFPYKAYYENDPDVKAILNEIKEARKSKSIRSNSIRIVEYSNANNEPSWRIPTISSTQDAQNEIQKIASMLGKKGWKQITDQEGFLKTCLATIDLIATKYEERFRFEIKRLVVSIQKKEKEVKIQRYTDDMQKLSTEKNDHIFNDGILAIERKCEKEGFTEAEMVKIYKTAHDIRDYRKNHRFQEFKESFLSQLADVMSQSNDIKDIGSSLRRLKKQIDNANITEGQKASLRKYINKARHDLQNPMGKNDLAKEKKSQNTPQQTVEHTEPAKNRQQEIVELEVDWESVIFNDYTVTIIVNGRILFKQAAKCRKSYNVIKTYLADKLPKIVLRYNGKTWQPKEPITFKKALETLRRNEEEDLLKAEEYKKALRNYAEMRFYLNRLSAEELIAKLKERKQKYLNYLIKQQLPKYKLIPAIEMVAHESSETVYEEEVFIFTTPSKYRRTLTPCVNVIYENVNPERATLIFTVEEADYEHAVQSIYNFMNDESEKNKRSRLHQKLKPNKYIKRINVAIHGEDMHSWTSHVH